MKKITLTMLALACIINLNNCTPKKKKGGILDKLIPLALLGGGNGSVAATNGSSAATGAGNSETTATGNNANATNGGNTGTTANGTGGNVTGSLTYGSISAGATLTLDAINQVNYTPTLSGAYTDFTISPTLPDGLIFDPKTGSITGAATQYSLLTNYTITATGANMNPFSFSFSLQIFQRLVKTGQTQCWDQD
ncbi:MAG TPA: Ig domain-containing protein, partial [Leptospiraceae bacterium]|nr:Ig domain-containing protein [Leptospiraceae bacterium]